MLLLWGKYIRKYYLIYGIFFLIGVAALVLVDIYQLRLPEIIGSLVDKLNTEGTIDVHSQFFIETITETIIVAVVMFVGRILWRVCLFFASKKIEEKLRQQMFVKAESLDISYYHENKVGNILSWTTNDLQTLEEFLGWGSLMMVDGVFLTILGLVKMFLLNYSLAIIALIPILLIAIAGAICERHMSIRWKNRQESNDELYDFAQESFTGIRVVKAFVKEIQQIREFSKIASKNKDANVNFTFISVLFDVVIQIIVSLIIAIILGFGGWFVYATVTGNPVNIFGREIILTAGPLVTFSGYFAALVWPMMALGTVITSFSKARTSYRRIANFLDLPITVIDKEGAIEKDIKGDIRFVNFSFSYQGASKESLSNISLAIKQGEMIGVVGTVGSGKSTFVNALLRLYNVNEKQIFLDGVDIMDLKIDSVRKSISFAPQDNFLFSGTVKENITFDEENYDESKFLTALSSSDIKKDLDTFEKGVDTVLAENGATISGGQKQRIALARAYYKDSNILILDDVVSAVDLKTEKNIISSLKKLRKDKTTIIVASRVSTVMNMDKIVVLNKGHLEAFDTPANLLKKSETFMRMAFLQKLANEKGEK